MMALDKKYRDELLLALRLRDISGKRVGDVLAEVETHIADTGEDPVEAFGPPREYAEQVAKQLDSDTGKPAALRHGAGALVTGALTFLGVTLLIRGLFPRGDAVGVTPADTVAWPVLLAFPVAGALLLMRAASVPRHGRVYGIAGVVALVAGIGIGMAVKGLVDNESTLFQLAPWVAIVVGIALLAGAGAFLRRAIRRGKVVDPR